MVGADMVGEKVKSNLTARIESVKVIPDNAVTTGRIFMDKITELKPVQAVVGVASHLGDGVLSFINKNAEITRQWIGEIRS